MNIKRFKTIFLTTSLTIGLTLSFSAQADAAIYKAVNGDSLYKISRVFNTTVGNLMEDNNLKNYNLNIGQELYVPSGTYNVQKNDTLFLISQKFNITLTSLRRANNIYTDYILVGDILNIPIPITTQTPVQSEASANTASELDVLSRLIMAEAQGQPYEAQVAVGAVVINRVESGLFAKSINGVIYENINGYYQFTPVANGWINNPANEEAIRAAKEALKGIDPTNGALFYYDDSATNQWILSKPVSVKIGNMIYAY